VDKFLFYITCTTCQARLKVRDANAIGAILSCPKCESMVQVAPPPGWEPGQVEQVAEKTPQSAAAESPSVTIRMPSLAAGNKLSPPPSVPLPRVGEGNPSVAPPLPPGPPPGLPSRGVKDASPVPPVSGESDTPRCAAPPVVAAATRPLAVETASDAEFLEAAGACVAAPIPWQRWLLGGGTVTLVLLLVVGWRMTHPRRPVPQTTIAHVAPSPREPAVKEEPRLVSVKPDPLPGPLDPRWQPDGIKMLLNLQPSHLAALPETGGGKGGRSNLCEVPFGPIGKLDLTPFPQAIEAVLRGLGLTMDSVRRLSWASTELSDWSNWSVVVVELEPQHDAGRLRQLGQSTDVVLANVACRRQTSGPWTHPFAVLDGHTIVTGRAELLRKLSQRGGPAEVGLSMGRLAQAMAHDAVFALAVDVAAARAAGWQLPTNWMDVWPAGQRAWHAVWEMPEAIGLTIEPSQRMVGEVVLACESPSVAEKVHAALEELLPVACKAMAARLETIAARLREGGLTAAAADAYTQVLRQTQATLAVARPQQSAELVRVKTAWEQGFAELARAALESRGAMVADWYGAARSCDEANQRQLLSGLNGYQKAEGHFPEAASGAAVLAAETRLSWIATLLPYYGHSDWHHRLEFGYGWNSAQNRPIAQQPLAAVVNPALGPSTDEAGFPVTHYVGVAGLGADAGELKADDPRAGVFGNGRATRWDEMDRGAGNTIAILGAGQQLGAWAAGGHATVRGLTKAPYVNGPDGFGSGQPDGMLAGMADGSVRFVGKDVDPRVLEQLVTLHDGSGMTAAALAAHGNVARSDVPAGADASAHKLTPLAIPSPASKAAIKPDPVAAASVSVVPADPPVPPEKAAEPDEAADNRPEIDVQERLATIIPNMVLHDVPLAACLGTVGDLSGLAITLDLDAIERRGLKPGEAISIRLEGASVRQILEAVAVKLGLAVVLENNRVLLTSPREEREALRTVRYSVSDLARGEGVAALAESIRELVAPDGWKQSGGRGTIVATGDALLVEQTAAVHEQVIGFCEKLRVARRLPLRSQFDPARFSLATRLDRIGPLLGQAVMINFHAPAPLPRVLAALEEASGAKLLVNWVALGQSHISPEVKGTVSLQQPQPLAVVLDVLLRPRGLGYLAIEEGLIEVTTRKAIAGRLELEFYPVKDLLARDWTGPALVERIKGVAKSTWNDAGGAGAARLDEPSGHLMVLQSQPVQGAIERLLAELHAAKGPVKANQK